MNKENKPEQLIEFIDREGVPHKVTREKFQKEYIPYNKELLWHEKEQFKNFALMLLQYEFYEDALEFAEHLLDLYNHDEPSQVFYGVCLLQLENWEEAMKHFKALTKKFPASGVSFTNYAKALYMSDIKGTAIRMLKKGLRLDPNQDFGIDWYFNHMTEKKRYKELRKFLAELSEIENAFLPDYYLGLSYLDTDLEKALRHFRDAIEKSGSDQTLLQGISANLLVRNRVDIAVDLILPKLDTTTPIPFLSINMMFALAELGRFDESYKILKSQNQYVSSQLKQYLIDAETKLKEIEQQYKNRH